MATPYIGEIRMFAGNFAPGNWAFCDGSLLPISENETLFNLLGTTYGGDGQQTFALPDLRGRFPLHAGSSSQLSTVLGQEGGVEQITLSAAQMPVHTHVPQGTVTAATTSTAAGGTWASWPDDAFAPPNATPPATMSPNALGTAGGNHAHDNMPPFLAMNFIISLFGIYPSQS